MSHIFISYARENLDNANRIVEALAKNAIDTWIDWKSIPKGENWEQEINRGIEEADAFLFLISPASVQAEGCTKEIGHAVKNGKRILPIVLCDTDLKLIHPEISKPNWIFCRDRQDDFNKAIAEIQKTIHTNYRWLQYHTELQVKALKWKQNGDTNRLTRGNDLREAEQLLTEANIHKDPQPTRLQCEYILASQRNEVRQRRQITIGLSISFAVLAVLAFFAWVQRNAAVAEGNLRATAQVNAQAASTLAIAQRQTAQANAEDAMRQANIAVSRQLAIQALSIQQSAPDFSLLLSIEALGKANTLEARNSILKVLQAHSAVKGYLINSEAVSSLAFSPDGVILATGGNKGTVTLWDTKKRQKITEYQLDDKKDIFYEIKFSKDGKILAVVNENKIYLLRINSGDLDTPITWNSRFQNVTFSPNSEILATTTSDDKILFWDTEKHTLFEKQIQGQNPFFGIEFDSTGNTLVSCNFDGTIRFWDMKTLQPIGESVITNEAGYFPFTVKYSPNRKMLAVAGGIGYGPSRSNFISMFDLSTMKLMYPTSYDHTGEVFSIDFSPDSKVLVAGHFDGLITFWDTETGKQIGDPLFSIKKTNTGTSVQFSPDGSTVASTGFGNKIVFWNPPGYSLLAEPIDTTKNISDLKFTKDGKTIVIAGCADEPKPDCLQGKIDFWDVQEKRFSSSLLTGMVGWANSFDISPDDKTLAVGNGDGTISFWDAKTLSPIGQALHGHGNSVNSIVFNNNGSILASGGADYTIKLWDTASRQLLQSLLPEYTKQIDKVIFSPVDKILATTSYNNKVTLWNVSNPLSPTPLGESIENYFTGIAFSPDGRLLAFGNHDSVTIWDIFQNHIVGNSLKDASGTTETTSIESIAISPDGSLLVSRRVQ